MLHGWNTVLISVAVQQDISQKPVVHCVAVGHQHQAPAAFNVHWAALPLIQRVITVFPWTHKPSNLTCLLAEWETPFRLDLRLSVWIIPPVCRGQDKGQPPKAWLTAPRPDLVPDSSPDSLKTSTLICTNTAISNAFHLKLLQVLQQLLGQMQRAC